MLDSWFVVLTCVQDEMHDLLTIQNVAPHQRALACLPPLPPKHAPDAPPIPEFLEGDLEGAHALEVEDFFRTVLGVSNDWVDKHHLSLRRIVERVAYQVAGGIGGWMRRAAERLVGEGIIVPGKR